MAVTDDFNRADGGLGANWTDQQNAPQISGNAVTDGGGANYGSAFRSSHAWENDHTSQIVRANTGDYVAPAARMSGTGGATNWYAFFNNGSVQKSVAGSVSSLGIGGGTYNNGDTAKIAPIGTTIRTTINGGSQIDNTDSSLATGSAGIAFHDSGTPSLDNWEGTGEIPPGDPAFWTARPKPLRPRIFAPGLAR